MQPRCRWVTADPLYIQYHDTEWGVPIHDDRLLFEFLILEGMQAGLSWFTILKRRENYRKVLDNFNAELIVRYDQTKQDALMADPGIIRNKLKIQSIITNAAAYLKIKEEHDSFSKYLWQFTNGKPITNHQKETEQILTTSPISDALSKNLKQRGFKFVGSTICYAYMQAVGLINDHSSDCFRHQELLNIGK